MIEQLISTPVYVALSFVLAGFLLFNDWNTEKRSTIARIHSLVLIWTGVMYLNFIFEFLPLVSKTYYFDWMISTPLIVLAYGYSATDGFGRDVLTAAVLQLAVILTGLAAVMTGWIVSGFVVSSVLLLGVFYMFYRMNGFSENPVLSLVLVGTWLMYPVVWWVSSGDLRSMGVVLLVLPFVSKHVFSVLDVYLN